MTDLTATDAAEGAGIPAGDSDLDQDPHPALFERRIIHVDMDAFYAAVEVLDRPELHGVPLVVGGPPESRGVVCTASYEARKFGIRSAMACSRAARLCPRAVFVPPRFDRYAEVAAGIRAIFREYTPQIEPLSLDEAYLDVTAVTAAASPPVYASTIARKIREQVRRQLGLSCSAGVAPNKLVAKIASDFRKPDGLTVVPPERVRAFMQSLPVRKINGVGPVTEERLARLGIRVCGDVWTRSTAELTDRLGDLGEWLARAARGIDRSPVCTTWVRRSLGREETFAEDVLDLEALGAVIDELAGSVARALERRGLRGRTVVLKVKYADFEQITRRKTLAEGTAEMPTIAAAARGLLERTEAGRRWIRLVGVTVTGLKAGDGSDGAVESLDDPEEADQGAGL